MTTRSTLAISGLAMMLAWPASGQEVGGPTASDQAIVITAQPLSATASDLAACLARDCPPDEDIAATLRHADNLFLAGDYTDARTVLRRSIGRNKGEAKAYPLSVSALYRGAATVDLHVGERDSYLRNTAEVRDSLRAAFPDTDARVLMAQLEVGDMRARLGYPDEAEDYYNKVAHQAELGGQTMIVAVARIRLAWLQVTRAELGSEGAGQLRAEARGLMQALIASPAGQGDARIRLAALAVLAPLDRAEGRTEVAQALIREAATQSKRPGERPTLLLAEPLRDASAYAASVRAAEGGSVTSRLTGAGLDHWADVGFWVRPDGHVAEVELLRAKGSADWLKPAFTQLKSRLYTRTDGDPGDPGYYMVERYTLISDWESQVTGTHLRQRSPVERIQSLDLTVEQPSAGPVSG